MNSLSAELINKICSELPPDDLRRFRQLSRRLAQASLPFLFAVKNVLCSRRSLKAVLGISQDAKCLAAVKKVVIHPYDYPFDPIAERWDWNLKRLRREDRENVTRFFTATKKVEFYFVAIFVREPARLFRLLPLAKNMESLTPKYPSSSWLSTNDVARLCKMVIKSHSSGSTPSSGSMMVLRSGAITQYRPASDNLASLQLLISNGGFPRFDVGASLPTDRRTMQDLEFGLRGLIANLPALRTLDPDMWGFTSGVPLRSLLSSRRSRTKIACKLHRLQLCGVTGDGQAILDLLGLWADTLRELYIHCLIPSGEWRPSLSFLQDQPLRNIVRGLICYTDLYRDVGAARGPIPVSRALDTTREMIQWQAFGQKAQDVVRWIWIRHRARAAAEEGRLDMPVVTDSSALEAFSRRVSCFCPGP